MGGEEKKGGAYVEQKAHLLYYGFRCEVKCDDDANYSA